MLEVRDLPHLDRLVEQSGSSVVAVAFYSRVRRVLHGSFCHNTTELIDDVNCILARAHVQSIRRSPGRAS